MEDNLVLLTPKEGERMEDIIKLNNEWFVSVFEDKEPWSESCVSKVVGDVSALVAIDEATMTWENLEYAHIQVHVLKSCKVGASINGQIYNS